MNIVGYGGQPIRSFLEWQRYALPPKRTGHWKEGRSACELGRLWTVGGTPAQPDCISSLFRTHTDLAGLVLTQGATEHETRLPFSTTGPRSHDLMLEGSLNAQKAVVCIEAKADESFGGTLQQELSKAYKRSSKTNLPKRMDWLTRLLLGQSCFSKTSSGNILDELQGLSYQLFTAVAGTLLEADAKQADLAILILHEFRTSLTAEKNLRKNELALSEFLIRFLPAVGSAEANHQQLPFVLGPIRLLANSDLVPRFRQHAPLYICKLVTKVR